MSAGDDATQIFRLVDRDGDGSISFGEFSQWYSERYVATTGAEPDEKMMESIRLQWQQHDQNANGQLDPREFSSMLADLAFADWRSAPPPGPAP
eukprot:SAG22_NODE_789_length_7224_cov_2.663953_9_plen_94_part_00